MASPARASGTPGGDVMVVAEQLRRRVPGGIGTYLRGLLGGLEELAGGPAVTLWASRPGRGPDPLAEVAGTARLLTSPLPGPLMTRAWDRGLAGPRWGGSAVTAVHAPSLAVPPRGGAPLTVMVHDLAWRHEPDAFPPRGHRWHEAALGRALERADLLMAPSAATADDLLAAGADPRRVEVVEEGCDHLPPPDPEAARQVLAGAGVEVGSSYLLTVSTIEPRKNLARLVQAYALARPRLDPVVPLVVVGRQGWGPALVPAEGVVLAGPVSGGALAGLYQGARLVVSVPLREGFGLPPVEAMRAGTPVVASPMPSTGGAAHEVDPLDVGAIADALVAVAGNEARREELAEAGRLRSATLTWAKAARRHVDLWAGLGAG